MKAHFAAHGWHAKRVAVTANAFDHAFDQIRRLGVAGHTKRKCVHRGDGAGAHGKHITQDAAHTRGRPLMRFDITGVVVALHLEDHRLPIADIHHACVFTRAANDLRASGGQLLEVDLGGLVRAMLIPHRRKDAEFGERGFPTDDTQQAFVLVWFQAVARDQVRGDGGIRHARPQTWRDFRA